MARCGALAPSIRGGLWLAGIMGESGRLRGVDAATKDAKGSNGRTQEHAIFVQVLRFLSLEVGEQESPRIDPGEVTVWLSSLTRVMPDAPASSVGFSRQAPSLTS